MGKNTVVTDRRVSAHKLGGCSPIRNPLLLVLTSYPLPTLRLILIRRRHFILEPISLLRLRTLTAVMPKTRRRPSRASATQTLPVDDTPSAPRPSSSTLSIGAGTDPDASALIPPAPPTSTTLDGRFFSTPPTQPAQAGLSRLSTPPENTDSIMAVLSRMEQKQTAVDQRLEALQSEVRACRQTPSTKERTWAREGNKKNYTFNIGLRDQLTTATVLTSPEDKDAIINKAIGEIDTRNRDIILADKVSWSAVDRFHSNSEVTFASKEEESRWTKAVEEDRRRLSSPSARPANSNRPTTTSTISKPLTPTSPQSFRSPRACYTCGDPRHLANSCPNDIPFDHIDDHIHILFEQDADHPKVRGRLRERLDKWRAIGACPFVLRIIEHDAAIQELLAVGSVVEVPSRDHLRLCSPLKVVPKKGGKLRLIINLHFLNTHLAKFKFCYDGIPCLIDLFRKGDWFVNFDLRNGYHHIDIADCHMPYLGFTWSDRFFIFASLPFGLLPAPFAFTKLMRPVVAHWRGQGFRCFMYLDDGSGADISFQACSRMATVMRQDLADLGLLAHQTPPKTFWTPRQVGELLGYINLRDASFQVPPRRCELLSNLITNAISSADRISARSVARITRGATGSVTRQLLSQAPLTESFSVPDWYSNNSSTFSPINRFSTVLTIRTSFAYSPENHIHLTSEWIPRDRNEQADYLSKIVDFDDYKLNVWWNPRVDSVNAFTLSWAQHTNWLFPPPRLIPRVLSKIKQDACCGTLIAPSWRSAAWWPLLCPDGRHLSDTFVNWTDLPPGPDLLSGAPSNSTFARVPLGFRLLALRFCLCGTCHPYPPIHSPLVSNPRFIPGSTVATLKSYYSVGPVITVRGLPPIAGRPYIFSY
ncbi:hypothetical protein Bbelb_070570 [Branchiostoma belcheri]|nr:hypothetical protein Bbelb_070570 [Branchiostoma belcheri]